MKINIWSLLLVIVMVIAVSPVASVRADALASDDYTQWKQGDPEWNQEMAWPQAPSHWMSESGCWVTSVAMLLRHYGVVQEGEDTFNPWVCNSGLMRVGAVDSNGDMVAPGKIKDAYPGFPYAGYSEYGFSALKEKFDSGYACMVLVRGGAHMVAVRYVSDTDVYVMDPGYNITNLKECGAVIGFYYFGPFNEIPSSKDYVYESGLTGCTISHTLASAVITDDECYLKSLPYKAATNENSRSLNNNAPLPAGTELIIDEIVLNTKNNIWYRTTYNGERGYISDKHLEWIGLLFDEKISDVSYPRETLRKGSVYPVAGRITTSHNPEKVIAAVYSATGQEMFEKTEEIDMRQEYSISAVIDNAMTFNTLPVGEYSFVIRIIEMVDDPMNGYCYDRTVTLVDQSFSVS